MKRKVLDLLKRRDLSNFPSIELGATPELALRKLKSTDSGALLILDKEKVVGVISERDFARYFAVHGISNSPSTLSLLMTSKVIYVTPEYTLEECMIVMSRMKIRHLPVLAQGFPIAFLSMRHIVEALVDEKQHLVSQLTAYITGISAPESMDLRPPLILDSDQKQLVI